MNHKGPTLEDFGFDSKELLVGVARDTMGKLVTAEREIKRLRAALEPFAHYYKLNDCYWRDGDDALEVPIKDLREAAFALEQKTPKEG